MNLKLIHPSSWKDYELIDSGNFEKLERFGQYILIRPEPQAIWNKSLAEEEWKKMAHAKFVREQKDKFRFTDDDVKGAGPAVKECPKAGTFNTNTTILNLRYGWR